VTVAPSISGIRNAIGSQTIPQNGRFSQFNLPYDQFPIEKSESESPKSREVRRSQWVDATLAQSPRASVYEAKFVQGR